jgi:hypothetical protein
MRKIAIFSLLLLLVIILVSSGCSAPSGQNPPAQTSPPMTPTITPIATPVPTTIPTTIATPVPPPATPAERKITDGYWCRKTTINIGNAPTEITECYQFLPDGTFRWGYTPGQPMGKSLSCQAPNVQCEYTLNADGRYEVKGGYLYKLSGDQLVDPHDPPYFTYTATGIP